MLLTGPISHTSIQYMDCFEISIFFFWICLLLTFLVLMGVGFHLCLVVTLSQNAITCFLHHYIFIISQLRLTSHPRSTVVLLDTEASGTSREIYSEELL